MFEFADLTSQEMPYIERLCNYEICLKRILLKWSEEASQVNLDQEMDALEEVLKTNDQAIEGIKRTLETQLLPKLAVLERI